MPGEKTQDNANLFTAAAQAGAKAAGESFVNRALNNLLDGCAKRYGMAKVLLGSGFERYLKNASERYNQVHTIATGNIVRSIIGQDNIYVNIGVKLEKKEIDTSTVDPLLSVNKHILIEGTGGVGKSMMMRYLFLNTANRGEYVPVLLELRKISKQSVGAISILDLIYTCMNDFDVELPRDQFEYSLQLGKYLFLMDGFDEVKENMAAVTAEQIQQFCSKYPNNLCIITTRPGRNTTPLETFTTVEAQPLSKYQAISLAKKIWDEDEKTIEFCRQLEHEIFDNEKHREFAENPLLLTMMFLTFMRNNSLPDHLADFYRQAYEALYNTHDSKNKGAYRREFKCDNLDAPSFRRLLSRFCFQSYLKQDYEFSEEDLLSYFNSSINKLRLTNVNADNYLDDLKKVVCLLVKDGEEYRFAHRSFQAYFAACYTAEALTDDEQKKVLLDFVQKNTWPINRDYLEILYQLEQERMTVNLLEDTLRLYLDKANENENAILNYTKMICPTAASIKLYDYIPGYKPDYIQYVAIYSDSNSIQFALFDAMFEEYILKKDSGRVDCTIDIFCNSLNNLIGNFLGKMPMGTISKGNVLLGLWDLAPFGAKNHPTNYITPAELGISETDMNAVYQKVADEMGIEQQIANMSKWLEILDKKRENLQQNSFIDEL